MAPQKMHADEPLFLVRHELRDDDLFLGVRDDQGTILPSLLGRVAGRCESVKSVMHSQAIDSESAVQLPEAERLCNPYFSFVQRWLPEVEGHCIGKHSFVARLGKGAFARVYASPDADGGMRAVKVINKSRLGKDDIEAITSECNCLSQLSHPNICGFKGTINGCQNFYIFMEFAGSTTLHSILYRGGPLGRSQTRRVFPDILQGVDHMHGRGIAHCDLRPANVVISQDGIPKIVDFGLAVKICETNVVGPRGTFPFIAPEAILGQGHSYDLAKGDMWSLGVLLLETVCGVDKVNRMLGWAQSWVVTPLAIRQLVSFLNKPNALEDAITPEVGQAASKLAPLLESLLFHLPEHRWDTKATLQTLRGTWI